MTLRTARLVLVASLLIFVVRAGLYISLLPANEMPDELAHVQQIRLAQYWPNIQAGEVKAEQLMRELTAEYIHLTSPSGQRPDPAEVDYTPVRPERRLIYFRALGGLLRWLGIESPGAAWYLLRATSLLFGLAILLSTWAIARLLIPERPIVAAGSAAFLALLPQFAAMSSVVSTDKPAELAGALFFLLIALAISPKRAWPKKAWPAWVGLLIIILCLPFIKKTAFFLILVAGLAAWPWWRNFRANLPHGRAISWTLAGLVCAFFMATIFWAPVANPVAHLIGLPVLKSWWSWMPGFDPQIFRQDGIINFMAARIHPLSLGFWNHLYLNLQSLFQSSWATYGYLTLPLAGGWYLGAWLMLILSVAGWLRFLFRPGPDWLMADWQGRILRLLVAGAFFNIAVTLIRQITFMANSLSQGRYIFPTLVPLTILGCLGFLALWPRRMEKWALAGALLWVAAMDMAGMWQTIAPYFYYIAL